MTIAPGFTAFLGVDQTGAVMPSKDGRMRARPLHVALLKRTDGQTEGLQPTLGGHWTLRAGLVLPSLSRSEVLGLLERESVAPSRCALLADCVLGLDKNAPLSGSSRLGPSAKLWSRLQTTQLTPGLGLTAARAFFDAILASIPGASHLALPQRECERFAKANSVFKTHPFQKNIQTGTFRLWKDLTSEGTEKWLNFWPFEDEQSCLANAPWIFEGYPSMLWRDLFGLPTRDRLSLRLAVEKRVPPGVTFECADWERILSHPDIADAAVLALGGGLLAMRGQLEEPFELFRAQLPPDEGWIAGLDPRTISSSAQKSVQADNKLLRKSSRSKVLANRPKPRGSVQL